MNQCPHCAGRKSRTAQMCRKCRTDRKLWPNQGQYGENHPTFRGGQKIDHGGYILTWAPRHPWPRPAGYVGEHVRVMELHLGRRIRPDEAVHHRNHDRQDNRLGNLELMDATEHARMHGRESVALMVRGADGRFLARRTERMAA